MEIQFTWDSKGQAFWEGETVLRCSSNPKLFFDENCRDRGTEHFWDVLNLCAPTFDKLVTRPYKLRLEVKLLSVDLVGFEGEDIKEENIEKVQEPCSHDDHG